MFKMYPYSHAAARFNFSSLIKTALVSAFFTAVSTGSFSQVLSFHSPVVESGVAGQDGAVYRFRHINDTLDALVTINGRSTPQVALVNIDDSTNGYYTAFQPIVTFNNDHVTSATDWWMDYSITFVKTGTTQMSNLMSFASSALDIDGNGSKISEYVSFYYMQTYSVPDNSEMTTSSLQEFVNGKFSLIGEKIVGPSTNYPGIDSANTNVMVSTLYANIGSFRVRTGAQSTSASFGSTRDYSFTFATMAELAATLPAELLSWNGVAAPQGVALSWTAARELNASHYVIERSTDGIIYKDAAMVFAHGDSTMVTGYSYTDKLPATTEGIVYYRLRIVESNGYVKESETIIVRMGKSSASPEVKIYPNPVVNMLAVSVPEGWQNKPLNIDIYSSNGQIMRHIARSAASQTTTIDVENFKTGIYMVRISNGAQTTTQQI
ncbi:MAG: T9SS type A sorting domain-containing protein, partial [Bacteroidetes bacterium]|nr:T9SS type A sorting domain-containing protein [Bacteroidota bacterium]